VSDLSEEAIIELKTYTSHPMVAMSGWPIRNYQKELFYNGLIDLDEERNIIVTRAGLAFLALLRPGDPDDPMWTLGLS
jgi:hypothetical protein